jgi:hypothetical protein
MIRRMRRAAVALLWFWTGWTAGAFAELVASWNGSFVNPALGPLAGLALAILFAGDPLRMVWRSSEVQHPSDRAQSIAPARP